jgi:CheY-like chemotaxis protein
MKKNYLFLITGCLFFLTLTYFSIWWIVLAIAAGLIGIAYRAHLNRINGIDARKTELELELVEKCEQLETAVRLEKNMRRKIEEIQKSKTAVLNKISHEIRTPMNGMMGMASLMGQTSLNSEQEEYLETIRNCGKNMITTINDILLKDMLNFSVGETGQTILEQTDFNIRNCVEEVLDYFSSNAEKTGIELTYHFSHDVPEQVTGDEGRVRQILLNLIENALENTPKGEVFVGVTLKESDKKGKIDLAFEVKDTGSGIPNDKLTKILLGLSNSGISPLVQAEEVGLGLIISDRLVKIMGGRFLIMSKPAEGTTVLFNIVLNNSIAPSKRNPLEIIPGLDGKKILLVVKNPSNGLILKGHLERWRFDPFLCASGKQALEILSSDPGFELLLLDLKLPDNDGIQLTQKIQELYPGLPAILMNSPNDEHYQQFPELFKSILPRPVRQNMLFSQVSAGLAPHDQHHLKEQNGSSLLSDKFSETYPLHILIAEDNPINQQFAVKILNRLGYKPEVANDGKEVLEIVSHKKFDLILMDVEMTVMDGLEATRMIRLCLESQPVIIAMTANAMQGDREICLQAGMDDYLSKPVDLDELVRILEKWALAIKENL